MKIKYKEWNPNAKSALRIEQANTIINEYRANGYTLTLRQLYYQFVIKKLIPNTQKSYKALVNLITNGREAGLISWEAIEDRTRKHNRYYFEESSANVIDGLDYDITFDQWARQDHYIEVWVEKDALSDVISRPCRDHQVSFMACKGYLSASASWRAGNRFRDAERQGKNCVLIHLGDHDPSGLDMTRDNDDRLELFARSHNIDVRRIALNMDQIEQYGPPPNPAKTTDSRATGYIDKFGPVSWELDALEPSVIENLIDDEISSLIDRRVWDIVENEEQEETKILTKLKNNWSQVSDFLGEIEDD